MSGIKGIILGFCAASLALGAIYMLRPKGAVEKSIRLAFAVIFLCITVMSVAGIFEKDIKVSIESASADFTTTAQRLTEIQAAELCRSLLSEKGFNFTEIKVYTDNLEDGSIFIKRITVTSRDNPEEIKKCILSAVLTNGVEVINE